MSHCANYVWRIDGVQRTSNSRWGGKSLPREIFWGPAPTRAWLEDLDDDRVYGELMCEGACLVDFDRRELVVFGGEDLRTSRLLQLGYVEMLRLAWPGWQVAWAHGGWAEIAARAGLPLVEAPPDDLRDVDPLPAVTALAGFAAPLDERLCFERTRPSRFTVLTVGDVDHAVGLDAEITLRLGPGVLDRLPPGLPVATGLHGADGGAFVDPARRRLRYYVDREERAWLARAIREAWPGWDVARQDLGLAGQLGLASRPAPPYDPRAVRDYLLGAELRQRGGIAALVAELRERARQPGVVVAPGALEMPPEGELSGEQREAFLAAILAALD